MSSIITPMEALRRCIEAMKLIDYADCKDETVWQALGAAQGVAEGVMRDFKNEPVAHLRFRAAQQWSGIGGHDIWRESCGGERCVNMYRVDLGYGNIYYAPVASGPSCVRDATHWMPIPLPPPEE